MPPNFLQKKMDNNDAEDRDEDVLERNEEGNIDEDETVATNDNEDEVEDEDDDDEKQEEEKEEQNEGDDDGQENNESHQQQTEEYKEEETVIDEENSALNNQQQPTDRKIELEIYYGEGVPSKTISIDVVNQYVKKPFIGGFRHKVTGVEYHHASSQTAARQKTAEEIDKMNKVKFHRETQTKYVQSRSQQTYREQGTQMVKPGLALDDSNDREVIITGQYFSADMLEELRRRKAIVIQAYTRGWFARKLAKNRKLELEDRVTREEQDRRTDLEKTTQIKRKEIERRMHPKKKQDFDILYNQLESWRLAKTEKIKQSDMSDEEKKRSLMDLLRKETKLLQTIDRLKHTSGYETKHDNIHKKLKTMADPKVLENKDGGQTMIETPFTIRARELMDLYHGLNTDMLSIDERLDVLLHVKWTVKEFDCRLTRDIVELIDREADLLNRGRKDKSLVGLRKRLSNLFLNFIEQPEFNPEAIQHVKIPLEHMVRPHIEIIADKKGQNA